MLASLRRYKLISVAAAVLVLDSVGKIMVSEIAGETGKSFFILRFGIFMNSRGLFGLVGVGSAIVGSIFIFILLLYIYARAENENFKIALALIFVGGLINLYERVRFGGVRDIFAVANIGYFNLADMAILAGMALILYWSIKETDSGS